SEKKPKLTESEKFRAETARMAAEQAKFREGLQTDEEKAAEKRMFDAYLRSKLLSPGQAGIPPAAERRQLGPLMPVFKLTDEAPAGEKSPQEPKRKEDETLQRKAADDHEISVVPPIVDETLQSSGQPLDAATRAFMEPRFGQDFSHVRVHTDP